MQENCSFEADNYKISHGSMPLDPAGGWEPSLFT